jgi:hypothetical protein
MPEVLEKIREKFRPMEVRPGTPIPPIPGCVPFTRELNGFPRFSGTHMGVDVLWNLDVLNKFSSKPNDIDFTAEYLIGGRHTRILGRNHRYLDYPVNVFLNVCMLHDGHIEIVDFCLNLLAEIAPVNWCIEALPEPMRGHAIGGKDAYSFDREGKTVTLNIPTSLFRTLPASLTESSGALGKIMILLAPGEIFCREQG